MTNLKYFAGITSIVLCTLYLVGCGGQSSIYGNIIEADVPRTEKPFLNDPQQFQFVVIGDRTGGHRPGVFSRAMDQINLLRPEFVVSVGDLIEGYTDDPVELDRQWDHIDATVGKLKMPFFYTVGNHDISNTRMQDLWRQRLGRDYYSFIYQDVLFISLNTEDPPVELPPSAVEGQLRLEAMMRDNPQETQRMVLERSRAETASPLPGRVEISAAQQQFVADTLQKYSEVRWTILLMHKPAWQYQSPAFEAIEAMLAERNYSVIAGHEHYYLYTRRYGRDYIDMGTTGGIWLKDGPGRLDHITWVTMTENGPEFANIKLDGLFDKNAVQ